MNVRIRLVVCAVLVFQALVAGPAAAASPADVMITVRPAFVCTTERPPVYLNVDFIVRNHTDREVAVREIQASVLNRAGETLEKRIVWQEALDLIGLGPRAKIAPSTDGLIYNPLHFSFATPGSRVEYAFDITGQTEPITVTIVPQLCRTRSALVLPITGRVAVRDGHDVLSHHRRFNYLAPWARKEGLTDNVQRFALDLVMVDAAGRHFRGDGIRNEDFYGWGQAVRAPADGLIVAAQDGQPDNDKIGRENRWHGATWESSHGNYVVIRHHLKEFSVITHMRHNSLRVRTGDKVRRGQIVGQVGNSGSSLMPHVHYQLQDGAGVAGVHGVPAYFRGVRLLSRDMVRPETAVLLDTGDFVIAR